MGWLGSFLFLLLQADSVAEIWLTVIEPAEWVNALNSTAWWACCGIPILLLIASQAVFVVPVITYRPRRNGRAASLMSSMIAAAFVAAALCLGLACGMYSLAGLIWGDERAILADEPDALLMIAGGLLLASWGLWSVVLIRFAARHERHGACRRPAAGRNHCGSSAHPSHRHHDSKADAVLLRNGLVRRAVPEHLGAVVAGRPGRDHRGVSQTPPRLV